MKKRSSFAIILTIVGALALLSFWFLSVGSISIYGGRTSYILGFSSVWGIDIDHVILDGVNWWGIVASCCILIATLCDGLLVNKNRNWYYVSTVLTICAAIIVFLYHKNMLLTNDTGTIKGVLHIGAGQIVSGSLLAIMSIGNIFAAYQDKQTS